jgi:hypothetical protein
MLDLVDRFREKEARDELGIGVVRDAFADMLFPGTSTIQTRARYFLFVPWIYRRLERRQVSSAKIAARARRDEIRLIHTLLASEDSEYVIGRYAKDKLKRLPSSVYWQGMRVWGILQFPGSQEQYHRSLDAYYVARRRSERLTEDKEPVGDLVSENWHPNMPGSEGDFLTESSFVLRRKEAAYLRERILTNCTGTLLAFLVEGSETSDWVDFPWEHPQYAKFPAHIKTQLHHARAFSEAVHGAALLYNLMLSEASHAESLEELYSERLTEWARMVESSEVLAGWDRGEFWEVIDSTAVRVSIPTRIFLNAWLDIALARGVASSVESNDRARTLIRERELARKREKARLSHARALELWGGAAGAERLVYRWPGTHLLVSDILAFTIFDWEDENGSPTADPLALFESLRRYADRISIFCQAGHIAVPVTRRLLLGYLEGSVVQVSPSEEDRVFHPKVWALRFLSDDAPVLYRLLVLSRNLTFDRSWDTVLVLEGELSGRKNAFRMNHPLGNFFAALPDLAVHDFPERVGASVDLIQHELRRVWFEPPDGFASLAFWPLGLSHSRQWPFHDARRMLVISPFVKERLLARLPGTEGGVLVSRPEALGELEPESIERFEQTYVLRQEAESEEEPTEEQPVEEELTDEDEEGAQEDLLEGGEGEILTGLHAKLFVADDGWNARIWTGSANATNAAFSGNVEFLVELEGRKSFCGIDKVLSKPGDATGFADMLQKYEPASEESKTDPTKERLAARAEEVRRALEPPLQSRGPRAARGQGTSLQEPRRQKKPCRATWSGRYVGNGCGSLGGAVRRSEKWA